MEFLIIFAVGVGTGYALLYLPYREVLRHNEELRARENFRIGYKPKEAEPQSLTLGKKPVDPLPDLQKMQEEAYADTTDGGF